VDVASEIIECGYETDHLAVSLYQERQAPWSVGIVAVLRGGVDAVVETSACFLIKQINIFAAAPDVTRPEPSLTFGAAPPLGARVTLCSGATHWSAGGHGYTGVWLSSSEALCTEVGRLGDQRPTGPAVGSASPAPPSPAPSPSPAPGRAAGDGESDGAPRGIVLADPNIAVRVGPSTTQPAFTRLRRGASARVICYTSGESVTSRFGTSGRWDRVQTDAGLGFVPDVYLDTGDDIATQAPRCPDEAQVIATVLADPGLGVREGPATTQRELSRLPVGTAVTVLCLTYGERLVDAELGTSNRWAKVELDKSVGFIAAMYLDTGGDITIQVPAC
jgi:uncharacterized protein YraI